MLWVNVLFYILINLNQVAIKAKVQEEILEAILEVQDLIMGNKVLGVIKEIEAILIKEDVAIITKEIKVILDKEDKEAKEAREVTAKKIQLIINKEDKVVMVKAVQVVKEVGVDNMETMVNNLIKVTDLHIKVKISKDKIQQIFQSKINFSENFAEIFNIINYANINKLENVQEFMDLILNKKFIG